MPTDPASQQKKEENVSGPSKTKKEFGTSFPHDAITEAIFSSVFSLASGNLLLKPSKTTLCQEGPEVITEEVHPL